MFRPNCKWFILPRSTPVVSFTRFYAQNVGVVKQRNLGNQIKLIGRVNNQVLELRNGFNSFYIKTASKGIDKFNGITHPIKAQINLTEVPKLSDNDLVHVTGEIVYEKRKNGEKFVSFPHILAKKIIRMENNNKSDDLEQLAKESVNEVKLVGTRGGIITDENATTFPLVTNAELTSKLDTNIFEGEWHRVLVFDEQLREFVRNHLKIKNRLVINGEILYRKFNMEDGTIGIQANVLAKRIHIRQLWKEGEVEPPDMNAAIE